jgi:hypothetical protein
MIVGTAVMALVITGGLVALGQATLLSEKSTKQVEADFILRQEVETLRSMAWSEVDALRDTIDTYEHSNPNQAYPNLQNHSKNALTALGYEAAVSASELQSSGELGRTIFKILLTWRDKSGKEHQEARVLTLTEGGFSADS